MFLLSAGEKRRGLLVLTLVVVMAALEVIGVASVMPFLSVLGNPALVAENEYLNLLYQSLDFASVDAFLVALGIAAFSIIVVSAALRGVTTHAMNRFVEMRRHSIGQRLLETYLRQPYAFFLNRHSSDMAKTILSEVDQVIMNVFRPGMMLIAYGVVAIAIVGLLVAMNPLLAGIIAAVFVGLYSVVYLILRRLLGSIGADRRRANQERFEAASEALGGIKDIKLLGREDAYLRRFRGPSIRQAQHQATSQTVSQVPSFMIEALAFGSLILLTLIMLGQYGGARSEALGEMLPLLGLYAFAGVRLKPAAQHVFQGFAKLRFGAAAIDGVYDDLVQRAALAEIRRKRPTPLVPRDTIALENVSFRYPNAHRVALSEVNITIPVGTSIGLVGATGAGKTTLVDLLLGLLRPTAGALVVDGHPVTDANLAEWQAALGYVPQEIFLTDASVTENIALGVASEEIDQAQVEHCARMAQVHDFIVSEMPQGYATTVGERGVRLSGGQRQRIGIARALYHDPSVLVFDEATSALDTQTEDAVMREINALASEKTLIIIAHRLSTVEACDAIAVLDAGQVASWTSKGQP